MEHMSDHTRPAIIINKNSTTHHVATATPPPVAAHANTDEDDNAHRNTNFQSEALALAGIDTLAVHTART